MAQRGRPPKRGYEYQYVEANSIGMLTRLVNAAAEQGWIIEPGLLALNVAYYVQPMRRAKGGEEAED